jgi:hypothetical protein
MRGARMPGILDTVTQDVRLIVKMIVNIEQIEAHHQALTEHSPVVLNPQFQGGPEPLTTHIVVTANWSDRSPAPLHSH